MLNISAIHQSHSPWASTVVLVWKKDGGLRFCIDLRRLNNWTVKDVYSLPRIDKTLDSLQGSQWFSPFDLKSGYWQVKMDEESKPLTGILWVWKNAFQAHQCPCNIPEANGDLPRGPQSPLVHHYLDYIVIFSKDLASHLERLEAVFQKLEKAGLKLKPSNVSYSRDS